MGAEWFKYLEKIGIPFCIMLKESILVIDTRRGGLIKLKNLLNHVSVKNHRGFQQKISDVFLRICATLTATGVLLILAIAGDENVLMLFYFIEKNGR